jgi:hypothetical protein
MYVVSAFIWMLHFTHALQVFLSGCCIWFAMTLQVFSGVFANVSDTYCTYFICLQTHVAMFHLDVSKYLRCCICCNMTHLPQLLVAAAGASCMCVESGGMKWCAAVDVGSGGGSAGSGVGSPHLVRACNSCGHSDVRALVISLVEETEMKMILTSPFVIR